MNKKIIFAACAITFGCMVNGSAQTIGAEFDFSPNPAVMGATNAGVLGETFVNYDATLSTTAGVTSASQSLGDGVTLALSSASPSVVYSPNSGYEEDPFTGEVAGTGEGTMTNPNTITFTLSGLQPGGIYNVVAYAGPTDPQGFSFDGGATYLYTTSDQTPGDPYKNGGAFTGTFTPGENYVEASVVAVGGNITIIDKGIFSEPYSTTGVQGYTTYYAETDGIGLAFVSAAAPEPSTWALLGIGIAAIGGFHRIQRLRFSGR